MAIIWFFLLHWYLSVFCQTFFLHRYGAHKMFTMSKSWERFFHILTYLSQGASYLNPRGYALLHRLHHAYSDTARDPHSPIHHKNIVRMMLHTKERYSALIDRKETVDREMDGDYPEWYLLDVIGRSPLSSVAWIAIYTSVYYFFAPSPLYWVLLPGHFFMGPIHGAIVNWCGHMYGYRNFDVGDHSKNTLAFDILTFGELFQNNHHRRGLNPNFAARWFEIDPGFQVMKLLAYLKIVTFNQQNEATAGNEPTLKSA